MLLTSLHQHQRSAAFGLQAGIAGTSIFCTNQARTAVQLSLCCPVMHCCGFVVSFYAGFARDTACPSQQHLHLRASAAKLAGTGRTEQQLPGYTHHRNSRFVPRLQLQQSECTVSRSLGLGYFPEGTPEGIFVTACTRFACLVFCMCNCNPHVHSLQSHHLGFSCSLTMSPQQALLPTHLRLQSRSSTPRSTIHKAPQ